MSTRPVLTALIAILFIAVAAPAQEMEERGQLAELVQFRIDPAHTQAWEAAFAKITEAAQTAGLADEERWSVSQDGNEYILYYPVPNMAYFDDPTQFMRKFEGTPGEALLMEGFGEIDAIPHQVQLEVVEAVPGWAYEPAEPGASHTMFGHVTSFWLKPGMNETFGKLVGEFYGFFEEIGYGYTITGHRVRFGDVQRVDFVSWYDDPGAYHGSQSYMSLVESKEMTERWGELIEKLNETISRVEERNLQWKPEMSLWPST